MYHIFKNEIKRKLKNPVLWILILMMIILLYISVRKSFEANEFDAILKYDPAYIYFDEEIRFSDAFKHSINVFGKNYEEYYDYHPGVESPSFYKARLDNYEIEKEAYYDNDIKEQNRTNSFNELLYANHKANSDAFQNNYLLQYICEVANNELWEKVSGGIKYDDINFSNVSHVSDTETRFLYDVIKSVSSARYSYYLYSNNLKPIPSGEYVEFNNLYVINKWIKEIIPMILVLILLLLNYDLINKGVKEGSTKLLISQSMPRWKYYLSKFFASTIIVVFTIILPLIVTNLYLKTNIKSQPMNYPIVYDKQGLTKLKPSFNFMEENFETYGRYEHQAFYKIPYSKMDTTKNLSVPLYQRNTDLIGFNKFLMLTSIYTLLFIMFMVSFIQLCSTIFNNTIISLLATTGIYGLFYFLFNPYLYGKHYNLCPFTMSNSARIVGGTHNVTMLTAFLVLTSATLILLFVGTKYFKRKEI